jgi:hypothetical protein
MKLLVGIDFAGYARVRRAKIPHGRVFFISPPLVAPQAPDC